MNTRHLYTGIARHTYSVAGIAFGVLVFSLVVVGNARAQSDEQAVQFPVAELGNCGSQEECKTYCDEPDNIEACIAFAEENDLMPPEEIEMAKKFIAAGAKGPGGCTGKDSCETYCNDLEHIDVCLAFAEENDLMPPEELQEAKKVQAAIKSGVKPPPCGSKKACDAYCESPDHMSECITFAKAAGLMSEEDMANADKMLQAIQSGVKPPACRGKEECDEYCSQDEHFDECMEFGKAAGFMNDEEYEMAKKTRGKGPGGCRGKEECDAFCNNSPENEEVCFNFGKEHGLIPEEQLREMEEGNQKFRESFSNMPPEVASCLSEKWGAETFEKLKNGEARPSRNIGDAMSACFGQFEGERMQREGQQRQMMENGGPGGEFGGPPPEGMPEEYRQRYEEEYRRQFEAQMQERGAYQCEGENCRPPEGMMSPPPEGTMVPPEGMYGPPPEGIYQQPPEGTYQMPPEGYMPPSGPVEMAAPVTPIEQTAPAPTAEVAPAPVSEPAPAPTSAPAPAPEPTSGELLAGAAILFLKALGFGI